MSSICLLDFPVEIFHRIFDYLDTRTIIRSLRCVCRQLNGIVNIYNRYEIDLTLFTKVQCEFILQSICCENIISLIFSVDFKEQSDKADYLLTILNIQQFSCLRSLKLLHVNKNELDRFLPCIINFSLISLSIQLSDFFQTASLSSLSTAITQWKLRKLHIFNGHNLIKILPWPVDCNLNHLTITSCTDQEYRSILEHSPFLRTFVMEYCLIINTIPSVNSSYPQLTSLVMNYSFLSFGQLNSLLSLTPSLVHLKLINHTDHFSSLFDGNRWEELIQSKLRLLKNFQFCFRHTIRKLNSTFCTNLHSIIQQYRTPFWLDIKRWFVIADCIMRSSILFYLLGKLFDNTPRKKWKRYFTLSSLNWGTIFPVFTNFIVITLVYSIIAPLMLLISGFAFGLFYIAYAYTMFYVTDFPNDAGGLAFPRAIYQSFTGIYLMEIMLATLFFLAQNDSGSQSAIVEAIFMCVSIAITVAVQYTMCTSFDPLTYYLPIDAEEFSQLDIPVSGKFGITKKVTRILNHRQSINDSDSVSTVDQAVNEVYDNTMENAYLHPALRDPKPIIWIPRDNLGIAVDEVQKTEASGMNILMSTEGARFNDKVNIEIHGAPPDHMPFTETNQVRTRF
ncbi:unnamed protein product [Adineta steineri]|uniref:F-box domain-containing protein n=1 Tax=Adineta steineri TaxID=433720 RepID=A0A814J196_9BILA|nr:unnamed protein product [Adineta steineri]